MKATSWTKGPLDGGCSAWATVGLYFVISFFTFGTPAPPTLPLASMHFQSSRAPACVSRLRTTRVRTTHHAPRMHAGVQYAQGLLFVEWMDEFGHSR